MTRSEAASLNFRDHLRIEDGRLIIDGHLCDELAKEFGTPLYVLSENRIRHNYRAFQEALARIYPNVLVCPAYKANWHLAVARIYQMEGAGAEVVSPAELKLALESEVEPEKIVYNGPLKKFEDLEFAISSSVGLINADSFSELKKMQEAARRVRKPCNTGIRVNLGMRAETHPHLATALREHKFGIWLGDAITAYTLAAKNPDLSVIGIHSHIGSNITQSQVFSEMSASMFRLVGQINDATGLKITKIDMGGGLGSSYQVESSAMTYEEYAAAILSQNMLTLRQLGEPTLVFEPGRAIVADAGILLTRVDVAKRQGDINWAIVDAGMNTFLRPALYQAKHHVVAANRASEPRTVSFNLGGPCCESGDVIAKGIISPMLKEGDLLAVLHVGAYGFSMASNYNGQPRPAVVLITGTKSELIRRRETYEEMIAGEMIPSHLSKQF